MQWKKISRSPTFSLTGLGTFFGLLVDFQGATTKVLNALPVLQALLPIVILGGTIFFGLHAIGTVPRFCYSFIHSRLPGVRWGEENYVEIRTLAERLDREYNPLGQVVLTPGIFAALSDFSGRMHQKYALKCPYVTRDSQECIGEWLLFLSNLSPYAATHNLKGARTLWEKVEEELRKK